MKKRLFATTAITALFAVALFAQKPHTMVFYNVENFFDTINDPDINDEEFTPEGKNRWTGDKYYQKLANIEQVFFDIAAANKSFPTVIGVSEVEVRSVLEDIASTPKLSPAAYRVVHYDSPERRGVDVAFFYRPDQFKLEGSFAERAIIPDRPDFRTRDILTMWGKIEEEDFFFMVAHWSSRWGGKDQSEFLRIANATQMRSIADSVRNIRPNTKFVLMGDFNDDPNDKSVAEYLGAKGNIKKLEKDDLYTPFYSMLMAGYGTLAYGDAWNIFDNIVVSENLVNAEKGELELQKSIYNSKYYGNIFKPSYLIQQEGKYKGYPFRSFSGGAWVGGYSDHLPVFINID
ncbi:MAG: endonuclease/exonuclease/phosphatase family protein [Rikenellaceae bacterium]